jgi:hypothetical protein
VYSARDLATLPCGLIDFIDHTWGGRPEFKECLTRSEIQTINKRCIAFGYRYEDDNVHDYLYFDGDGNFGSLFFDQDDRKSWEPCIRDILSESAHVTSLEALLQDQFEIIGNAHDD